LETILSALPVVATGHPTLLTPSSLLPVCVGEHGQRKYQINAMHLYYINYKVQSLHNTTVF